MLPDGSAAMGSRRSLCGVSGCYTEGVRVDALAASKLTDRELLRRVDELARQERDATVDLIAHLAELDKRSLYRGLGYGSLFSYCTQALWLSEHAALNRIEAARASRTFPVLLDCLADGAVNLSTVRLLAPHLTPENHERLLDEARGRSKREVALIVARLAPQPDVPSSVRKLPAGLRLGPVEAARPGAIEAAPPARWPVEPTARPTEAGAPRSLATAGPIPAQQATLPIRAALAPSATPRPVIAALTPERYRIQFTVTRETHEMLRHAQDLLRREIPDGDPGVIFERALMLLLEDVARRKLAATTSPRHGRSGDPRSRHIPADVKRKVWLRDHGRCAFVSSAGRRCRERTFLEFHHVDPYALGGETTVANVSLRCREHNAHEAELVFGPWRPGAVHEARAAYSTDGGPFRQEPQRHAPNSPRGEFSLAMQQQSIRRWSIDAREDQARPLRYPAVWAPMRTEGDEWRNRDESHRPVPAQDDETSS